MNLQSELSSMILDMLAAIARKDYENRCLHQSQGVQKAKKEGMYKGRPINKIFHPKIKGLPMEKKAIVRWKA